jgi:hypothetical protein
LFLKTGGANLEIEESFYEKESYFIFVRFIFGVRCVGLQFGLAPGFYQRLSMPFGGSPDAAHGGRLRRHQPLSL